MGFDEFAPDQPLPTDRAGFRVVVALVGGELLPTEFGVPVECRLSE